MTKEEFSGHIWDIVNEPSAIDIDQLWADIEAERGVVVDWSKAPDWANGVCTHFTEEHKDNCSSQELRISYIPRPAPKYREMTREEKIEALDSLPSREELVELLCDFEADENADNGPTFQLADAILARIKGGTT